MRYLRVFIVLLAFAALPWNPLWGQNQPLPDPPKFPVVERLPSSAQWMVKYPASKSEIEEAAAQVPIPTRRVSTIAITKADGVRRELVSWANGAKSERWFTAGYLIETEPNQDDIYVIFNHSNADIAVQQKFGDFSSSDFPELAWVSPDTYSGTSTFDGSVCYLFQREVKFQPTPKSPVRIFAQQAWIDGPTRRPIAFNDGSALRTYHFEDGKPPALILPQGFAAALEKYQKRMAAPGSIHLK